MVCSSFAHAYICVYSLTSVCIFSIAYLMSSNGQYFDNPFLKKSVLLNIMEVFVPDKRVFYTKEEVLEAEGVEPFNSTVDAYLV